MTTALTNPDDIYKLNPEALEFVQCYLSTLNLEETAEMMGITKTDATTFLHQKEVKRFMDTVFMEQGYMNRFKLTNLLEKIVDSKLEEAEETGVYTGKDLVDVLTLLHKIQTDHLKIMQEPKLEKQTNVQINNDYGSNLGSLISRLVEGES